MTYAITAQKRTSLGKRSKDELAISRIPAVMYGKGVEAQVISLPQQELIKLIRSAGFSSLIDVTVEGSQPVKAVLKAVQYHYLTSQPTHVDLHMVRMDEEMTAKVPLKFIGEAPAVKIGAGTLVKSLDEIEVTCLPADLPHEIEVDLTKLITFDDAITIGSIQLPKGVSATMEAIATIATVARPLTEEELKKIEESSIGDVTTIKTEGEEKRAEEAKKTEEEAAAAATTVAEGKK